MVTAGIDRSADLRRVLSAPIMDFSRCDHRFRPRLVFQQHAERADPYELANEMRDVESAAMAGIAIDDDCQIGGTTYAASDVEISVCSAARTGFAEGGGGHAVAGEHHGREPGAFSQLGRQGVVDTGDDDDPRVATRGCTGTLPGTGMASIQEKNG